MSTSKTKTVSVSIKDIQFNRTGELVIIGLPNEFNEKGSYVMNAAQEQRLLQRVGLQSAVALKHLISLSNGTSKLSYVASYNKAGEAWDNGKEGTARKSSTFEKDWIGFNNHEIELGFAAKMKIADAVLTAEFANPDAIRGRVTARPVTTAPITPDVVDAQANTMDQARSAASNNSDEKVNV